MALIPCGEIRTIMNEPYRDHPTEDALERFLLNQFEKEQLEIVEMHILGCEACITRLQTIEVDIRVIKLALRSRETEQSSKMATTSHASWLIWPTLPRLSFASAALAICALALIFVSVPRQIILKANRGAENTLVSQWLPLDLHLNAGDLPTGPVHVEIVDAQGGKIWQAEAIIKDDDLDVKVIRLTAAGQYFVRVSSASKDSAGELLREYGIEAKSLF
jgi:hypothetical protein